jgi:hypothetical protein
LKIKLKGASAMYRIRGRKIDTSMEIMNKNSAQQWRA